MESISPLDAAKTRELENANAQGVVSNVIITHGPYGGSSTTCHAAAYAIITPKTTSPMLVRLKKDSSVSKDITITKSKEPSTLSSI